MTLDESMDWSQDGNAFDGNQCVRVLPAIRYQLCLDLEIRVRDQYRRVINPALEAALRGSPRHVVRRFTWWEYESPPWQSYRDLVHWFTNQLRDKYGSYLYPKTDDGTVVSFDISDVITGAFVPEYYDDYNSGRVPRPLPKHNITIEYAHVRLAGTVEIVKIPAASGKIPSDAQ